MRNLVIDIGNTTNKIAVFEDGALLKFERVAELTPIVLNQWVDQFHPNNSTICSVGKESVDLQEFLVANTNFVTFNSKTVGGISNNYTTPDTLGLDRLAKLIAVFGESVTLTNLIIDAGSCITFDLLLEGGEYYGGSISPGINMRFKSLHTFTDKLPMIDWNHGLNIPQGDNTENAIIHGVLQGILNETTGYITASIEKYSDLTIWLTGGDAEFLSHQFKNSIFAPQLKEDPLLVLKGLNKVITLETCT